MTVREIAQGETRLAHRALAALRPQYGDEERFVRRVDEVQRPEGFRLVGSFEDGAEHASSAAGFRVLHNLAWGDSCLYVDDLSTAPDARRRGHAGAVLDWLIEEARRLDCEQFHLDSGTVPERYDAHRLYMSKGLAITAHHFTLGL